jgi:hypothetical protein
MIEIMDAACLDADERRGADVAVEPRRMPASIRLVPRKWADQVLCVTQRGIPRCPKPVQPAEILYCLKTDLRRRRARQQIFCPFSFRHGDRLRGFALAASRNHIFHFVFEQSGAAQKASTSDAGKIAVIPGPTNTGRSASSLSIKENRPGPRGHPYRSQSAGRPTCFPSRTPSASGERAWECCVGPLAFARCMSCRKSAACVCKVCYARGSSWKKGIMLRLNLPTTDWSTCLIRRCRITRGRIIRRLPRKRTSARIRGLAPTVPLLPDLSKTKQKEPAIRGPLGRRFGVVGSCGN